MEGNIAEEIGLPLCRDAGMAPSASVISGFHLELSLALYLSTCSVPLKAQLMV